MSNIPYIKCKVRRSGNGFYLRIRVALVSEGVFELGKTYLVGTDPVEPNRKKGATTHDTK